MLYLSATLCIASASMTIRVGAWILLALQIHHTTQMPFEYSLSHFNFFGIYHHDDNKVHSGGEERYLGDSNLDWGQGLPALKEYIDREKIDIIYLSYYGTAEPSHFGIRYQLLPVEKKLSEPVSERIPRDAKRHIVAIGATNLQGIYTDKPDIYAFLRDIPPTTIVGGCIWVWDLTDDPKTLDKVRSLAP
jgi:hypothetical protein